jgi:hypothetical protein
MLLLLPSPLIANMGWLSLELPSLLSLIQSKKI